MHRSRGGTIDAGTDREELLFLLPYDLRVDVRQYVGAVDESRFAIFEEAQVELTKERRAQFLYLVALRKLWMTVDATVIGLRESIETLGRRGIPELQIGTNRYGAKTHDYRNS